MATKDWEPLILFIGALVAFLAASIRLASNEAKRGEGQIMKFYIENISTHGNRPIFSCRFDANLSFKLEQLSGLITISDTEKDPNYKFKTKNLEQLRRKLILETNLFLSYLFRTAFENRDSDYFTIPIKHREEHPRRLNDELKTLNSSAKTLLNTYEQLCDNFRNLT